MRLDFRADRGQGRGLAEAVTPARPAMRRTSPAPAPPPPTLWPSPWPCEDGGPRRTQVPTGIRGLDIQPGERLQLAAHRDAFATTMVVLRNPGEVFALRHTMGRRPRRDPSDAWVERIDPRTLEPLDRSETLPGGPFWPGGLVAHGNGSLHVVHGRHCHRLSSDLRRLASRELPRPRPYNSLVVLGDGTLAMKDLDLDLREPARIILLDPETLEPRGPEVQLPEAAVARLSADGDALYVVGDRSVWRLRWDGERLLLDERWDAVYHGGQAHSYGWDPVIGGGQIWFMDNGAHDYQTTMRGAGRCTGAARLIRISLRDPSQRAAAEISGLPRGTVTNPPLYDERRRIVVGYDSGNGVVTAFHDRARLEPVWQRRLDHAGHMILFPDTGELVLHDFQGPAVNHTAPARAMARRFSAPARSAAVRRALSRSSGDTVVVLDIETGAERARAHVPSMFQSVLFPAPGFERDLYWCTFSTLARLEVV